MSAMTPSTSHPPPPKRLVPVALKPDLPYSSALPPTNETWGQWAKRKGGAWGKTAMEKGIVISDNVGGKVNGWAEHVRPSPPLSHLTSATRVLITLAHSQLGGERFWPTTGDFEIELAKCERILREFTVEGVGVKIEKKDTRTGKIAKKVLRKKIPAKILREAKGIVIFSAMRNGIAPFGGSGGTGVIMGRLEDGTWSAPSFISPNNATAGLMLGLDIYSSILVLRTQKALESFYSMAKVTLGTELAVAAGPYGSGASLETGMDRTPVLSYVKTRGFYAGIEVLANAFLARFDENERLQGRVRAPREAEPLLTLLEAAESGEAQRSHGAQFEFDEPVAMDDMAAAMLDLDEGETLKLPPTPDQLSREEEEEEWERRKKERDEKRYLR
ncbi:SPOSA6832_00653 [Sporobolomyces salmonicolor]|uniref:SPOSA6832_00653-mRNA-1:cds n=1 Tax=Sporidiobolus salmonicolor TaxID=5005 RepID=A0A0D6EGM2_SPOSA|nr:SPOSA6832_00653 [Sporobolomyces salmonicolor]